MQWELVESSQISPAERGLLLCQPSRSPRDKLDSALALEQLGEALVAVQYGRKIGEAT